MIRTLTAFIAGAAVFIALDMAWLGAMGPVLYRPALAPILADKFSLPPALAFYGIYAAGILVFAVWPAFRAGGWSGALVHGLFLGLVAYATYDLTNQATLRIWPLRVTILDVCWGAFATGVASVVSYLASTWINRAIG
jgi:uncharacterized membrane protein